MSAIDAFDALLQYWLAFFPFIFFKFFPFILRFLRFSYSVFASLLVISMETTEENIKFSMHLKPNRYDCVIVIVNEHI